MWSWISVFFLNVADWECTVDHYKCHDSFCIPLKRLCDGVTDCPLGDDENRCGKLEGEWCIKGSCS